MNRLSSTGSPEWVVASTSIGSDPLRLVNTDSAIRRGINSRCHCCHVIPSPKGSGPETVNISGPPELRLRRTFLRVLDLLLFPFLSLSSELISAGTEPRLTLTKYCWLTEWGKASSRGLVQMLLKGSSLLYRKSLTMPSLPTLSPEEHNNVTLWPHSHQGTNHSQSWCTSWHTWLSVRRVPYGTHQKDSGTS